MTVHRVRMCACGHEEAWHGAKKGPCKYGHGTFHGGCTCDRFHGRSRAAALASNSADVALVVPAVEVSPVVVAIDAVTRALMGLRAALTSSSTPQREDGKPLGDVFAKVAARATPRPIVTAGDGKLTGAERKVLSVLAQHPNGRSRVQVALLSGYSQKSSGFKNTLSTLRTSGRIEGGTERMTITEKARRELGAVEQLPGGRALISYWEAKAGGKCERVILSEIATVHPSKLSRDALAHRTEYSPTSSGFKNALSRLRTLGLISGSAELGLSPALASALEKT